MAQAQQTLLLTHEISSVLTAIRYTSKWSLVSSYYEEERSEPNKYDDAFRALKREIYRYEDWSKVDPMVYLGPFLSLLKATDVGGTITGTVAVALQRILASDLILPDTVNGMEAINQLADDTRQAKFQTTGQLHEDEVVLLNIVNVLAVTVECKASVLLTDETYIKIFQAVFMMGDPVNQPKLYGEIVGYYSRQVCVTMVRILFQRLRLMADVDTSASAVETLDADKGGYDPPSEYNHAHSHSHFLSQPVAHANLLPASATTRGGSGSQASSSQTVQCLHGAKAACEIMDSLVQLIGRRDESFSQAQMEETIIFALEMVHTALLAAGPVLAQYEIMVAQVHVELLHAMCQAVVAFPTLPIITGVCQILSCLYTCLGSCSIGQLELVITRVLLRLADGTGVMSNEQQEVALEGILDLVRTPGFVHDMFVNCDCRLDRSNLFEELCGLLSRTAHPAAKGALSSLHLISLEALTAILQEIAVEGGPPAEPPLPADLELPFFVDIWTPMVSGQHPDLSELLQAVNGSPAGSKANAQVINTSTQEELLHLRSAAFEKHLKEKVALAVDHFNKDYKKGFQHLQALRLMPMLEGSPAAVAALANAGDNIDNVRRCVVSEDDLAKCVGHFLHFCPGLNKVTIGTLLGEPDAYYLKVLDAYTASFDFSNLKFDAGIRMFLESFRLPGEAQKIDRIINSFGKHFYQVNQGIFRNADAAYVLAYSVIMLNTDRHSSQVKKKMELDQFRRNLRGVNDGQDFPEDFLNELYNSIVKTQLRIDDTTSLDVSEQMLLELHQLSHTPRGHMTRAHGGRHLFDKRMFQLLWSPAVSAMCGIIDNVRREAVLESALTGLTLASTVASVHNLDDVADTIMSNLAKIPMQRPDVLFGRDVRMMAVTRILSSVAIRHGDSLSTGWVQFLELLVVLYRQGILPDTFTRSLDGDGEGGLAVRDGEGNSLRVRRIAAAKAAANSNRTFFTSLTSILSGSQDPVDPYGLPLSDTDRQAQEASEALLKQCAFEEVFIDSKFLKQESLDHLVRAVIVASGPIPRPSTVGLGGAVSGSLAYTAGGHPMNGGWDVSELMLELLFSILLRNRDRIGNLWPMVYDHLNAIFRHSRDVDPMVVQKAVMAVMRLCLRLLPYKPHISEPLVKGVQLVSLVDDQVAAEMATTIAAELLSLLKGAAPYLKNHQVWVALFGLLKIIQYDPSSFSICVEALSWVVREGLNPYNFALVLVAIMDLLERAAERTARGLSYSLSASLTHALNNKSTTGSNTSSSGAVPPAGRTVSAPSGASASAAAAAQQPQQPVAASGSSGSREDESQPLLSRHGGDESTTPSPQGPGSPPNMGPGDPVIAVLLILLKRTEEWLEVWWLSVAQSGTGGTGTGGVKTPGGPSVTQSGQPTQQPSVRASSATTGAAPTPGQPGIVTPSDHPALANFPQEAWVHVMSTLCRAIKNPNLQIRLGALDILQRSVVAAEKFLVPASVVQRVILQLLVPLTSDMCKQVAQHGPNAKDFPQADVCIRELVRALAKVVLLYAPLMGNAQPQQPSASGQGPSPTEPLVMGSTWGPAWRAILDCMVQGITYAAPRSELLAEAIPEAAKNMVLMLHAKGALREGWRDASDGTDLHDLTWRAARKISANLTPAILQLETLPAS